MIGPPPPPNNQDRVAAAVEASGPTREQLVAELAELKRQVSEHQAIDRRRRETEEALRESQRKLFTLMGNLPGMVYRCRNDKDWTMEFVSDGCLNLTGYPPDYILWNRKKSYSQLIHLEDQDYVWNCIQTALKRNAPFRLTYRITNSGGNVRWVLERGIGIFDEAGRLIALEGSSPTSPSANFPKKPFGRAKRSTASLPKTPRTSSGSWISTVVSSGKPFSRTRSGVHSRGSDLTHLKADPHPRLLQTRHDGNRETALSQLPHSRPGPGSGRFGTGIFEKGRIQGLV